MISKFTVAATVLASVLLVAGPASCADKEEKMVRVVIETSKGSIVAELDAQKAPVTVENFLSYAKDGYYGGTVFHRVIDGFMIQGGGMTESLSPKPAKAPIRNEAGNGLKNLRGTLAMARTNVVDSATAQFFINLVDNDFLDHKDETAQGFGYAVFGKVVQGMEVVDAIGKVKTGRVKMFSDVPLETVTIKSVKVEKGK